MKIRVIHVVRQFRKKELEVLVGVDLIGLRSLYEAIQDSAGFCPVIGLYDDEILPAKSEWSNGLLGVVVIHRDVSVRKELPKVFFLMNTVSQSLANSAVVSNLFVFRFCPLEIGIYSR